jgi:hypothetical protein
MTRSTAARSKLPVGSSGIALCEDGVVGCEAGVDRLAGWLAAARFALFSLEGERATP